MVENTLAIQVRWSDADPAGIAFYPRFFEWYDLGCAALFESVGLPWPVIFPQYDIVGVPIVESGSRFTAPVHYADRVRVRSAVAWVKNRTFRVEHEVYVRDTVCARGFEIRAWVARPSATRERLRAIPIPAEVAERLRSR
jgi:acyl-CoA thioesterase FadM